jgi:probable F420-dependent oxidoreductase
VVDYAVQAEKAGFHGVMIGEHVVLGPNAASNGVPENPRDWIKRGNQHPTYPHPSSNILLSAIAASTTKLRLLAAALLTPLRHPLLVAKELATLDLLSNGRLIFMPAVSWQKEEYEALGVPFDQRGRILDEQLEIWDKLWKNGSPVSHQGGHFRFDDTWVEPSPYRRGGPDMWMGGLQCAPWVVRRAVKYAKGFFCILPPTDVQLAELREAMTAAGRSMSEMELGAFLFGPPFKDATSLLDLDEALAPVPDLVRRGFNTLVIKPSQYIDDGAKFGAFCRDVISKVDKLTGN